MPEGRYWDAVQPDGQNSKSSDDVGRSRGADGGRLSTNKSRDRETTSRSKRGQTTTNMRILP